MGYLATSDGFYSMHGEIAERTPCEGEALIVADTTEAWVFHITALPPDVAKGAALDDTGYSAVWVAQRVPAEHMVIIANRFIIRDVIEAPADEAPVDIGDAGAVAIWNGLGQGHCRQMESIYLKDQPIGDEGFEAMCAAYKGGEAGGLPKLCHLQLGGNQLTDERCLCISNALEAGDLAHVRNLYVGPSQASVDGTECVQMVIDECSIGRTCHVFF